MLSDNIGYLVLTLAVLGWLAWNRYLHHKETMALLAKGADWRPTLEARDRWRIRWGILVGALIMAYGVASALGATILWPWVRGPEPRSDWIWVGVLHPLIGAIIVVAHAIWGIRGRRKAAVSATSESRE